MPARQIDHLILGGGAAAATAAATLRLEDAACSIMILSADSSPPYYRPALSKQFLLGNASEEQILLHPASYYQEQEIALLLNTEVVGLDTTSEIVATSAGERIHYGHLLIATGASGKRLSIRGTGLAGIHHLRDKTDCEVVRREVAGGASGRLCSARASSAWKSRCRCSISVSMSPSSRNATVC
jgi:NTE family protein